MPLSVRDAHSSVASCSIISECAHCIYISLSDTVTLWPYMFTCQEDGACIHSNIFVFCLYTVNRYGHTTIVAYVCVWFVVTLHVRGRLTFSALCCCSKLNSCYYWSSTLPVVCHFLWLSFAPPPRAVTSPSLYKCLLPIYIWSAINQLIWPRFYIDVLSSQTAMHASSVYCMECWNYLLTIMFVWGTKGSFELMRVWVSPPSSVGECVCVHAKHEIAHF